MPLFTDGETKGTTVVKEIEKINSIFISSFVNYNRNFKGQRMVAGDLAYLEVRNNMFLEDPYGNDHIPYCNSSQYDQHFYKKNTPYTKQQIPGKQFAHLFQFSHLLSVFQALK